MRSARRIAPLVSLLLVAGAFMPAVARAGVMSDMLGILFGAPTPASAAQGGMRNLQTLALPRPALNTNPAPATGGGDVTIVDSSALVPMEGPSGTIADIEKPSNGTISTYIVQPGDTLTGIAQLFDVPVNTIMWANDISKASELQIGQKLTILPIPGVMYTVQKGDTLAGIAKRFGGDTEEILNYNGLDATALAVGTQIIIPNGEIAAAPAPARSSSSSSSSAHAVASSGSAGVFANNPAEPAHDVGPKGDAAQVAYYIAPLAHYIKTQGIHGYNAVDLAAPEGTPIMAAASGDVVVAKEGGWNGGYGSYVVLSHSNGSQTLYGHMSKVTAYDGEYVVQGQVIGYVGETGLATGPHVHFEIRDGIRNPF